MKSYIVSPDAADELTDIWIYLEREADRNGFILRLQPLGYVVSLEPPTPGDMSRVLKHHMFSARGCSG
jgi:hypothetical protein